MPDEPAAPIAGAFHRPFREQAAFFRQKLGRLVPTRRWDDLEREAHDTAFMVAGAQKADLLADLAASVDRAVVEGKSLEAFRKDFAAAVERHDWHGWTGEDSKGGRAWRTRTIYRTNTYTSYAAGRLAQLREGKFPYWVYRHGGSTDPRPEHLAWDGLVLRADDPAWSWLYPPSDWGCSCYVVGAYSVAEAKLLGGDPDKPRPKGFGDIDPRTGAPIGVGVGWDYAPGDTVAQSVQAAAEKVRHWPYQIGKAFMAELPAGNRDALARAYRRLPSVADDARRYARRALGDGGPVIEPIWTLGAVTSDDLATAAIAGHKVDGFDFSLSPDDVRHIRERHGSSSELGRGQAPVTADDYSILPQILSSPDRRVADGTSTNGAPIIRYEKTINGRRYVAVMEIRRGRRTLALKTFYIQGKE